ncbi:MAG: carboxymuconolactone decarboxylase family protein [Dehalococcoidia bacterium]
MPRIKTVSNDEATGPLKDEYEAAIKRAGHVFHIVRLQSLRPRILRASMRLYQELMFSRDSGLSRAEREMIATTVSRENNCHY